MCLSCCLKYRVTRWTSHCYHLSKFHIYALVYCIGFSFWLQSVEQMWNTSRICISSLGRGHANPLCIVPVLAYVLPKCALSLTSLYCHYVIYPVPISVLSLLSSLQILDSILVFFGSTQLDDGLSLHSWIWFVNTLFRLFASIFMAGLSFSLSFLVLFVPSFDVTVA